MMTTTTTTTLLGCSMTIILSIEFSKKIFNLSVIFSFYYAMLCVLNYMLNYLCETTIIYILGEDFTYLYDYISSNIN